MVSNFLLLRAFNSIYNSIMTRAALLICALILTGCNSEKEFSPSHESVYFDVPSYFLALADSLDSTQVYVNKTLQLDGNTEIVRVKPRSWKDELAVFSAIDLNKSSYIGKYQIDSVLSSQGLEVKYISLDKKLPVKSISIQFDNSGNVYSFQAEKTDYSIILNSEISLEYINGYGYFVKGRRAISNLKPSVYSVSAIFAN